MPKTAVLLNASGVRPSEYWEKSSKVTIVGEGTWHVARGTLSIRALDSSVNSAIVTANGDIEFFDAKAWPANAAGIEQNIQLLRKAVKLNREFPVEFSANVRERKIGYIVRTPEPGPLRSSAQIVITVPGAEPEILSVAMEVAEPVAFWRDPVFTGFSGALIGFGFFVLQQRYTRKAEAQKQFEEKKIEKAAELWKFFHNTYRPLVEDSNLSELERVRNVRKTLLDENIYSLLPLDLARELNALCDAQTVFGSPLTKLDKRFRKTFPEFMS